MVENWKEIAGYEGKYEVSTAGNVRSRARVDVGQEPIVMTPLMISGYRSVCLRWHNKNNFKRICRLVALTFIPNPENLPWVNHKNGNKVDDRIENLEWVTPKGNTAHAIATGLKKPRRTAKELKLLTSKQKTYGQEKGKKVGTSKAGGRKTAKRQA